MKSETVKAEALCVGNVVHGGEVADVFVCSKPFPDEITVEVTFASGDVVVYLYGDSVEREVV